uniref:Secreted protein n=1 Tax=Cacopsylla melanoneura TaxID=428564 RepID=A0A8D8ZZT7_9HEMI
MACECFLCRSNFSLRLLTSCATILLTLSRLECLASNSFKLNSAFCLALFSCSKLAVSSTTCSWASNSCCLAVFKLDWRRDTSCVRSVMVDLRSCISLSGSSPLPPPLGLSSSSSICSR